MNTDELRSALRGATTELMPRPTLTEEVVRGGVRRVQRRRLTIVAVAAATAVAVGAATVVGWQSVSEPAQVATDPRLGMPTRGDLAKDTEFLSTALQVWETELPNAATAGIRVHERVIDRPHVYWAGTTPADRAAVILQLSRAWGTGELVTIRGLVAIDPRTGTYGLAAIDQPSPQGPFEYAFRFGPGARTVLALEQDQPHFLSAGVTYDNDGRPQRTWQPMASKDGAVLGELPAGTEMMEPKIVTGDPQQTTAQNTVVILLAEGALDRGALVAHKGLPWGPAGDGSHMMWAGAEPAGWQDGNVMPERFNEILEKSPLVDRTIYRTEDRSPWYLSVGLPDGKIATIAEYQASYDKQARIYAVFKRPEATTGDVTTTGPVNPGSQLPVLVKMTGKQGWAAAAKGTTLSYRTTVDGPWLGERADALLAPDGTVQIRVARPDQQPVDVPVPTS